MQQEPTSRLWRASAIVAVGALVASGLLATTSSAQAATPTTVKVTNSDIRPDETTYAGWHQGYDKAAYASAITSQGLESSGKSQILYGYKNNDSNDLKSDGVNADLDAITGASIVVKTGKVSLQVALFADLDGVGDKEHAAFTTLRPAVATGTIVKISTSDLWESSKALGDIAANTPVPLSTIIAAIKAGTYKTIGFGVLTYDTDSAVTSMTFNGKKYVFTADSTTATVDNSQLKSEETASTYTKWHQGYANATKNAWVSPKGLELAGKSQVIKGFNNNSANVKTSNVNLTFAMRDASYTVTDGSASFQIPLFFDNGSGVKFTTLRHASVAKGLNALSLNDQWQSSKDLGSIAANTDAKLSDIIAALDSYKVIGYGVLTYGVLATPGASATVSSITFAGTTTTFVEAPAAVTSVTVLPTSIALNEDEYTGWHQGAEPTTAAFVNDSGLNLGPDRSQVINGYENNSKNTSTDNVDLAKTLRGASYVVTGGAVSFQVPLFFDDANGDTMFATLRPAADATVGTHTFSLGDEWVSSKTLGSLPANTPALLGDILSSLGSYKVLGYGVYSNAGSNGIVKSITWDGVKSTFDRSSSKLSVHVSAKPKHTWKFWVYATVTSNSNVVGDLVTVTYNGKLIGSQTVGTNHKVRINLTQKLSKGKRSLKVIYAGGLESKGSTKTYVVNVK